jgi:general secretion pathway protein G
VNTGEMGGLDKFISPRCTEVIEGKRFALNLEGVKEKILEFRRICPDLKLTIEQQISEGEWVVTKVTARGTHKGVVLGMNPTGKSIEITAVGIDRVVNGLIVEQGGTADILMPFLMIGAFKVVAQPGDVAMEKVRISLVRTDLANIGMALDAFEVDVGRLPRTEEGLEAIVAVPASIKGWKGPYLKRGVPKDPWGHPYIYRCPGQHNSNEYDLHSLGPDGREGNDDLENWSKE